MATSAQPGATAQPEGNTQPGPAPAEQQHSDSARFAAIARKEAQLVRDREAFKAEQAAILKEKEAARAVLDKSKRFEELRGKDGIAALKEMGYSETDIFNMFASLGPKTEPTAEQKIVADAKAAAEAEIRAFKEEAAKKEAEATAARDKQLISGLRTGISEFIKANPEEYRYCAYYGEQATEQAYEIIKAGLEASKGEDLIDFKEAVKMAEDFFQERDNDMEKIRKRAAAPAEVPPTKTAPARTRTVTAGDPRYQQATTITRTRTLTNDARVTGTQQIPRAETREQKKERLVAQIKANGLRK